jgi:fermentation-respiration switch protein FrsA (DUF1100 family)
MRWVPGTALTALACAAALVTVLRRDQTHVFLETRERIVTTRVAEAWSTAHSRIERLQFLDAEGSIVSTVLVRLPSAPAGECRSLVVYAGKQTGDRLLDLVPERPDVLLVAPLYPRIDPRGPLEKLAWPGKVRRAVFATVAGGMAALAHLEGEEIPRGRTVVLAASLGSSFGTIHAALDERVDELVVVHGGGDLPLVLRIYYEGRDEPLLAAVAPWVAEALVDTFDPVHWIAAVAPRPVLLIASRRDKYFPAASVEALHAAAADPKRIVWTDTDHVGASKPEIVATIMAEIETYLDETAIEATAAGGV